MASSSTISVRAVIRLFFSAALLLSLISSSDRCYADPADAADPVAVAQQLMSLLDVILENHVAPQTSQQMLLSGIVGLLPDGDVADRSKLAREISRLSGRDEMIKYLATQLSQAQRAAPLSSEGLEFRFLAGVMQSNSGLFELQSVPNMSGMLDDGIRYVPAKQYTVEQQLRDNRYVGIGIALGMQDGQPVMSQVFPRGPAQRAGGKNGDLILSIDKEDVKGLKLAEVVDKLRGLNGQPVTVVVRQPDTEQTRLLEMVRGEVPFETVVGQKQEADFQWDFHFQPGSDVAYVKINSIRGSTARELKETASKLHSMKFRGLVLDLQQVESGDLRHATMICDQLLGQGPIGGLFAHGRQQEFTSDADSLFPGWPVAVLVGAGTRGQAEWIAAAFQDQHRGIVVGKPTPGAGYVSETIELSHGNAITLLTGKLTRADGKSLVSSVLWPNHFRHDITSMPGQVANEQITKPPAGWRGVWPDLLVKDPASLATVIAKLKEQLPSPEEPAAR